MTIKNRKHPGILRIGAPTVGAFALAATVTQSFAAEQSSLPNPATAVSAPADTRLEALADLAWRDGSVSVIAKLRVDLPQMTEPTRATLESRVTEISAKQDEIASAIADVRGIQIERFSSVTPYIALEVDEATLLELANHPDIEAVYEDEVMKPQLEDSTELIDATDVWLNENLQLRGEGTRVAILDTGIETQHGFLHGKIVHGECHSSTKYTFDPIAGTFEKKSESLCPGKVGHAVGMDAGQACSDTIFGCDHGTLIAGIISGSSHLRAGVAPRAELMSFQIASKYLGTSNCDFGTVCLGAYGSDVMAAMSGLLFDVVFNDLKLDAINFSWGDDREYEHACDDHYYADIINALAGAGVATIVASGNDGHTKGISAPACVNNAIAVGATSKSDNVANFSNSSYYLDLLAPGVSITTSTQNNRYRSASGTSFAAPHVAGAFLLARQRFPGAPVRDLLQGFWDYGKLTRDPKSGYYTQRIDLSWLIDTDPEDEYCDRTPLWVFDSGTPIPKGNLEFRGDEDWATILHFPDGGESLRIQLNPPDNRDYRIEVWNQRCSAMLGSSDSVGAGADETVDLKGYPPGTYRVRILGSDASEYDGEYQLSTTFIRNTDVCDAPAWEASQAYHAGDRVSFEGQEYVAWYWSQGASPDGNHGVQSTGLPWSEPSACECVPSCEGSECGSDSCGGVCGVCDRGLVCGDASLCEDPDPCTADDWSADQVYHAGDKVAFEGYEYQAWYWTQNQEPFAHHGPQTSGQPWYQGQACSR